MTLYRSPPWQYSMTYVKNQYIVGDGSETKYYAPQPSGADRLATSRSFQLYEDDEEMMIYSIHSQVALRNPSPIRF